ncbi:MAG: hypothetical protein IPN76_06105 [Saprospiraceae bacterium]|nr:hypothetical protein [Saprospiraceae bacterium]
MTSLSLQTQISLEQLYSLLAQLPKREKIEITKKLRAEISLEQWLALSKQLPDVPEIGMDEIIGEVKAVRKSRQAKK